jgi:H+/Cl- antiporter ClcA
MSESVEILLDNINKGLGPIMETISEFTGYSSGFIKENFDVMFYKAGTYLFFKDIIFGLGFAFILALAGSAIAWAVYAEESKERSTTITWMLVTFFMTFIVLVLLFEGGDILLYNTAKEAWILDAMSQYIR